MTRKEKAEARKNKRQEPVVQPAREPLDNTMASINAKDHAQNSMNRALSATQPKIEPVSAMPVQQASVQNTKGLAPAATAPVVNNADIQPVAIQPTANAFVQNEKGLSPDAGVTIEKPKTISDLIAEGYKKVEKEKTDAAKMQKYYALADAFSALGRMGGAAIGGAIGGDTLGGAPVVPEYKESRGYLEAFERAKKAKDRIKELDNMSYQLALSEEERKAKAAADEKERAFNLQVLAIKNQYDKDRDLLQRKWDVADAEEKKALELEIQSRDQKFKREMAELENQAGLQEAYVRALGNAKPEDDEYIQFETYEETGRFGMMMPSGTESISVPKDKYRSMMLDFVARGYEFDDGTPVSKDNVESYIRSHPNEVKAYLEGANSYDQTVAGGGKQNKAQELVDAI